MNRNRAGILKAEIIYGAAK